jgi:hypothetical protein
VARPLLLLVAGVAVACADEPGFEVTPGDAPSRPNAFETAGPWRFAGGGAIVGVRIEPEIVDAGDAVTVTIDAEGLGGVRGRLFVAPGPAASRQVVGEPARLADDPRVVVHPIELDGPSVAVELELGAAWHATTAVVGLEAWRGSTPFRVVVGARGEVELDGARRDGVRAVLGLVRVRPRPTQVQIPRGPIDVDGALADWEGIAGYALADSSTGEPRRGPREVEATMVRFAWDEEALYFAGDVPDAHLVAELREHDARLWEQDVFELFLAADDTGRDYVELQVSPRGTRFDARFARYREGDPSWNPDWVAVVGPRTNEAVGWVVEGAVPWALVCEATTIECPPRPGAQLRLGAFRLDTGPGERRTGFALSPTREPDFHAWGNAAIGVLGP